MSAVADRIAALIRGSGLSQREVGRRCGVSGVTVHKWTSGIMQPSGEALEAFCELFSVTPAYLLFGDGNAPGAQTIVGAGDSISIPQIDIEGSCGEDRAVLQEVAPLIQFVKVSFEFVRQYCASASPRSLQIITAVGDSMEPTIASGDAVIVDVSQKIVNSEGIYVVRLGNNILLKRIQIGTDSLILLSDNKRYQPLYVDAQDLCVVGRAYAGLQIRRLA